MSRTAHVHVHVNAHIRSHGPSFQRHAAVHSSHHAGAARHLHGSHAGGAPPVGLAGPSAAPRFVPQQLQDGFDAGPVGDGHPTSQSGGITASQLKSIMPGVSDRRAQEVLPHLNRAMKEAGITTPRRQAMFLAQLGHESGGLKWMEELSSGRQYEGRRDLGNTQRGDGARFKGRGPIQLTGRANYKKAGADLGLDLVNNPKRVADLDVGFRTAAWYWKDRGINAAADRGALRGATRLINPGLRGYSDRAAYYARAKRALGAT